MRKLDVFLLTLLWILAVVGILATSLFFMSGCTRTQVRYVTVPVADKREPCLTDPSVKLFPWTFTPGSTADAPTSCPEGFAACLTEEAFSALAASFNAMISRIKEDWILCGPAPPVSTPIPEDAVVSQR